MKGMLHALSGGFQTATKWPLFRGAVLVGDLVRFLRSLVEANQTAVLAMEDHDGPEMPPPIIDDRQELIVDPHLERGGDHRRYYQQRPSYRRDEDRYRGLGNQPGDSDHRDGAAGGDLRGRLRGGDRGVCRPHVAQAWEGTEVAGPSTGPS
jgi:hypothetical protein